MGQSTPLFIDRIEHRNADGTGQAEYEQRLREAMGAGREIRIEAGMRDEFEVSAGSTPVVYVMEGSVRFEGDDTPASAGDTVWFARAAAESMVGIEADQAFRGIIVPPARPSTGAGARRGDGMSGTETG